MENWQLVRVKREWVPDWLWRGLCVGNTDNPIDMGIRKLLKPVFWLLSEPAPEGEGDG